MKISIEAAQINAKISKEEAAAEIGVHVRTIANIEKGRTAIKPSHLEGFAKLYGVKKEDFKVETETSVVTKILATN